MAYSILKFSLLYHQSNYKADVENMLSTSALQLDWCPISPLNVDSWLG